MGLKMYPVAAMAAVLLVSGSGASGGCPRADVFGEVFSFPSDSTLSSYRKAVIADMDGDGRLDVVYPSNIWLPDGEARYGVGVLYNETIDPADPRFSPSVFIDLDQAPWHYSPDLLVAADVSADGIADLVFAYEYSQDIHIKEGRPGRAFAPTVSRHLPNTWEIVRLGAVDLTGDGHRTAVAITNKNWNVGKVYGFPHGNAYAPERVGLVSPQIVLDEFEVPDGIFADVTGDGLDDAVLLLSGAAWVPLSMYDGEVFGSLEMYVLPNTGTGGFGTPSYSRIIVDGSYEDEDFDVVFARLPFAGDLDADGDADLMLASNAFEYPGSWDTDPNQVFENDGTGSLTARSNVVLAQHLDDAAVRDFDGDGAADLVTIPDRDRLEIFYGRDDYPFPYEVRRGVDLPSGLNAQVVMADLNGDGTDDFIAVNTTHREIVLVLGGCAEPACEADFSVPYGVLDLADVVAFAQAFAAGQAGADLDGSGLLDLADVVRFVTAFQSTCP